MRKRGWLTVIRTSRTRRDAEDGARRTEDETVRGVYTDRAASERVSLKKALERNEAAVCVRVQRAPFGFFARGRAGLLTDVAACGAME